MKKLKAAKLTGLIFSLDHYQEAKHDQFRGLSGSFQNVVSSVQTANKLDLVTAFSLCATNEFISSENISAYMELAKRLDVVFVQILEPKPLGRYARPNVLLQPAKRSILEGFYDDYYKGAEKSKGYPILAYPDYYKRKNGCRGGKKYLYIDSDGKFYPCPFCKTSFALLDELEDLSSEHQLVCTA